MPMLRASDYRFWLLLAAGAIVLVAACGGDPAQLDGGDDSATDAVAAPLTAS